MTSDTCGPTFVTPLASWDRDSSCWKTSETTSLWALPMSSVTLPTWGGLHDGELFEHPTPERHTIAPDSSLLRTATAQLGTNGGSQHPDKRKAGGHGPTLADEVEHLLPTPKATNNENRQSLDRYGPNLGMALQMLPTPNAADGQRLNLTHRHGPSNQTLLGAAVSIGANTAQQSADGSACLDGLPHRQPTLDGLAVPA